MLYSVKVYFYFDKVDSGKFIEILHDHHLSVVGLCKKLDLSHSYFYSVLAGRKPFNNDLISRVFNILDGDFNFLNLFPLEIILNRIIDDYF